MQLRIFKRKKMTLKSRKRGYLKRIRLISAIEIPIGIRLPTYGRGNYTDSAGSRINSEILYKPG